MRWGERSAARRAIDDAPLVLAAADVSAVNNHGPLGADNGKGQELLCHVSRVCVEGAVKLGCAYLDGLFRRNLFAVILLVVVGVHAQVVELELLLYPVLELGTLLEGQAVALGDDGHDVDKLAQLLEHDNVNGLESVARGLDEEQAAVDARVLQIPLALGGQLLAEVGTVLVLDVLDNRVPAALVVDQVAVAGRVDNVEPQTHAVFLDDVRDGVDGGGAADLLVGLEAALAVHEVRGEEGVDERRLAETRLACEGRAMGQFSRRAAGGRGRYGPRPPGQLTDADDIELEATLDRLALNLLGDAVEADIAVGKDGLRRGRVGGSHCGRRGLVAVAATAVEEEEEEEERQVALGRGRGGRKACGRLAIRVAADFLVEALARERGSLRLPWKRRRARGLRGKARPACHFIPPGQRRHQHPRQHHRHGARPPAAPAVADSLARPPCARTARPPPAVPAAPRTALGRPSHAVRRPCDPRAPRAPVPRRHMERYPQRRAQEENVLPQEAPTLHGRQGPQGHHLAQPVLGMRASEAHARSVSLLCGWYALSKPVGRRPPHTDLGQQSRHTSSDSSSGPSAGQRGSRPNNWCVRGDCIAGMAAPMRKTLGKRRRKRS